MAAEGKRSVGTIDVVWWLSPRPLGRSTLRGSRRPLTATASSTSPRGHRKQCTNGTNANNRETEISNNPPSDEEGLKAKLRSLPLLSLLPSTTDSGNLRQLITSQVTPTSAWCGHTTAVRRVWILVNDREENLHHDTSSAAVSHNSTTLSIRPRRCSVDYHQHAVRLASTEHE